MGEDGDLAGEAEAVGPEGPGFGESTRGGYAAADGQEGVGRGSELRRGSHSEDEDKEGVTSGREREAGDAKVIDIKRNAGGGGGKEREREIARFSSQKGGRAYKERKEYIWNQKKKSFHNEGGVGQAGSAAAVSALCCIVRRPVEILLLATVTYLVGFVMISYRSWYDHSYAMF